MAAAGGPPDRFSAAAELAHAIALLHAYLDPGQSASNRDAREMLAASTIPRALPEQGLGERETVDALAPIVVGGAARLGDPGTFAHMDPPTPWITWATTLWNAALNQNLLHPQTAPVAREIEARVVEWLAPYFGMDGGQVLGGGSTLANLTALWVARESGAREVVASEAAHLSVRKSAAILGLPFRSVPVDGAQRLRLDALGDCARAALVLTAGTTASGAVDPLAKAAASGAAWVHVDAAWAGPLRLSPSHAALLRGIERADSIAVSAHKWLFQPKESALALFRDWAGAKRKISFGGEYLTAPNVGVAGSHGAVAVPLLATLLAWGRLGVAARIDHCMGLADRLATLVSGNQGLELRGEPSCGIVLWRPRGVEDLHALSARLEGAAVSVAQFGEALWLRSVAANPAADPERVVKAVLAAR